MKEKIGLSFQDKGLTFTKDKRTVLNNLKKIANEINKPNFNVGKIYNANQRKKWIDQVLIDKRLPTILTKRNGKIVKKTTPRKTLIPTEFIISISHQKVNLIYDELKKLKVDDYRNAVAVLFRVFLELSVDHFIKNKSSIKMRIRISRKEAKHSNS